METIKIGLPFAYTFNAITMEIFIGSCSYYIRDFGYSNLTHSTTSSRKNYTWF